MAKKTVKYKDRIKAFLELLGQPASGILCKDKNGVGRALFDIFVWQEVESIAKKAKKAAWERAADMEYIPKDEAMRALGHGEHITTESDYFSCIATITAGRKSFDPEAFILAVAAKYKIPVPKLAEIAEATKKSGTAPLEKRVIEA